MTFKMRTPWLERCSRCFRLLMGRLRSADRDHFAGPSPTRREQDALDRVEDEMQHQALSGFSRQSGALEDWLGSLELSPAAKRALDLALQAARNMGHAYLDSVHLVLGLAAIGDERVRCCMEILEIDSEEWWRLARRLPLGGRGLADTPVPTREAQQVMREAAARAGRDPVGPQHLLSVVLSPAAPTVRRLLEESGVGSKLIDRALAMIESE